MKKTYQGPCRIIDLFINRCQVKFLLFPFKLASLNSCGSKMLLNYLLRNEVSSAKFNTYKIIYN